MEAQVTGAGGGGGSYAERFDEKRAYITEGTRDGILRSSAECSYCAEAFVARDGLGRLYLRLSSLVSLDHFRQIAVACGDTTAADRFSALMDASPDWA